MTHKIRSGIVLAKICDEYLLISSKFAREFCPSVMQINETAAYIWKMLEKGMSDEEMLQSITAEYEVSDEQEIEVMLNEYLQIMADKGYFQEEK